MSPLKLLAARLVAWTCFLFGTAVSVGFNVLAAFLVPEGATHGWHPDVWTIVGAAVWPLALLGSIELLARVPWPENLLAKLIRYGAMTTVALFAFVISYQHIRSVLLAWHYNELSSDVGPLVIDGLMLLAGYAMVVISGAAARAGVPAAKAAPEPEKPSKPELIVPTKQLPDPEPVFGPEPPPNRVTMPLRPANGRRVAAASRPSPRRARVSTVDGMTDTEYVQKIKDRLAAGENVTKRVVRDDYRLGSDRAGRILRIARGEEEG